ncbi:MAG: phosphoribosyl-AMP cyclohydrolase [Desulfobacterales bacterium]|jgi:phosphoribosyl-AMP cyclohydrolase
MNGIKLDYSKINGLVPAVAQDHISGEVLMVAFMNEAAFQQTVATGKATYYSRSRNCLWVKGSTSGHVQIVKEIRVDCDRDTVLLKIEQQGDAACHTGHRSCFHYQVVGDGLKMIGEPVFDPQEVYCK